MPQLWPPQPPVAGYAPSVSNTTQTQINFEVTFPVPPIVVATVVQARRVITVQDITTTGFRAIIDGTTPMPANWVAIPAT